MAQAMDSAYEWAVNPLNRNQFSQQQLQGLASLAPQAGFGLQVAPHPQQLDPFSNLPAPQFAPDAGARFFSWEPQEAVNFNRGKVNSIRQVTSQAGDELTGKPYFDPNYPFQSMVAMRNYLGPQLQAGADEALRNRGLQSTGVGAYARQDAQDYLDRSLPQMTPQEALSMDFNRLYGPNITNALEQGFHYNGRSIGAGFTPGGKSFGDGSTNAQPFLAEDPYYDPNNPAAMPQFGVIDMASGVYPSPGYLYNPNQAPDFANMGWLANALYPGQQPPMRTTSQTSGTSGTAP